MFELTCPSCGAPVKFINKASLFAVCNYCKSASFRKDANLELYGKVADLQDDGSVLQIGASASFGGRSFEIVGRIQLKYSAGFWNEWYFIDDRGEGGWLSEAMGQYMVTRLTPLKNSPELPVAELLEGEEGLSAELKSNDGKAIIEAGSDLAINGKLWRIKEISLATCISGEGELPFKFDGGYTGCMVDLVDPHGKFATLDYSENPPYFFVGDLTNFKSLHAKNLKENSEFLQAKRSESAKTVQCTGCGAPIPVKAVATQSISCEYCGNVLDTSNSDLQVISKFETYKPLLPLGSKGILREREYEIIGHLKKSTKKDNETYHWEEYLLYNKPDGYLWLSGSDGHWMLFEQTDKPPVNSPTGKLMFNGLAYQHFGHTKGVVEGAVGEFYWKVKKNDSAELDDYIHPPYMISSERTKKEMLWTFGKYMERSELIAAFPSFANVNFPEVVGIAPAQPNPVGKFMRRNLKLALFSTLAAFIIQIGFCIKSEQSIVHSKDYIFDKNVLEKSFVTEPFKLSGGKKNVKVEISAPSLENNYVYYGLALINAQNDTALDIGLELSYYHGVDDGESWSEGGKDASVTLEEVDGGEYVLRIEPEGDIKAPLRYNVKVMRDDWRGAAFGIFLLLLFPPLLFTFWRYKKFENERMENSDYSYSYAESEDDD